MTNCETCESTDLVYGGIVNEKWYCNKHIKKAEDAELVRKFPKKYYLDKMGYAHVR